MNRRLSMTDEQAARRETTVRRHLELDQRAVTELLHRLARWRHAQELTQRHVAARMGTTQSAVAELEAGITDPRISTLMRLARAIGVRLVLDVDQEESAHEM